MTEKHIWTLAWYSYQDDSLQGEVAIDMTDDDVRLVFDCEDDEHLTDNFVVTNAHVPQLERFTGHKIDLKYAYVLGARTQ